MSEINLWAVPVAAASSFALGGLWYSPVLFGKVWQRDNGGKEQTGHPAKVFGVSFALALIAAYFFARLLGPAPAFEAALMQGLIVGLVFVGASFGINYQFADRSVRLWLIDGGYHTAQFVLFGAIFGLWH